MTHFHKNYKSGVYPLKRIVSIASIIILIFTFAFPAFSVFDSGEVTKNLRSDAYFMQSLDEETVLFQKNENKKLPMAGFVKIIAAATAIEKWPGLDEKIKITEKNISLIKYDYTVKTAGYKIGESVSKRELINCIIVYSANDAASIVAYEVSGSFDGFIAEMNAFVKKIGCESTVVKNLTGFDVDGQYTTVSDMAKIIKYAMTYPAFSEAFSATEVTLRQTELNSERTFSATNRMRNSTISDYYLSAVNAGKQTSTEKAGECAAVIASQDGYTYLSIVMKGKLQDIDRDGVKENTALTDSKKMLSWAYDNIRYRVVVSPAQVVAMIDVTAGKDADKVKLVPEKEVSALVPANATPASVLYEIVEGSAPEKLRAPVKQGDVIAKAKVYYSGQVLSEVNLVAEENVRLSFFGLIATGIAAVMKSSFFIFVIGVAAILALCYFALLLKKYLVDTGVITATAPAKAPQKKAPAKPAQKKAAAPAKAPQKKTAAPMKKANSKKPQTKKQEAKIQIPEIRRPKIDLSKFRK